MSLQPRTTLEELATVDYGVTASATQDPTGPKFLRITDIQNDSVNWSSVPHCECSATEEASCKLHEGDIVFARTGATTGKSFLIRSCPNRAVFASYLIRVKPDRTKVEPRYLAWFFHTRDYWQQVTSSASGTAQPGVNASKLKVISLPIVPLPEQRRIADILDRADALRRKRWEAVRLLDELLKSTFLEMFGDPVTNPKGWPIVKMEDIASKSGAIVDGPFGSSLKPECYQTRGVPVVRNQNIGINTFDMDDLVYVSTEKFEEIRRSEVHAGDVLMTTKGTIGRICLCPDLGAPGVLSASGTVRMRLDTSSPVSSEFAVQQMVQARYRSYIESFSAGSNQKYLSLSMIRNFVLIAPPKEMQLKFHSLHSQLAKHRKQLVFSERNISELFSAILQRAFGNDEGQHAT